MKTFSFYKSLLVFLLVIMSNTVCSQNGTDGDDRLKIRLGFTSVNDLHRQILVTADTNATPGVDFGYDAEHFENHIDDMYWMIDDRKFTIQGTDVINETTTLSLGLHTGTDGNNIISIEELINVPEDLEIGVLDNETNTYYDLKINSSFSIYLPAGEYLNRFKLIFINDSVEESDSNEDEDDTNETSNDVEDEDEEVVDVVEEVETDLDEEEAPMEFNYINRIKSISIKNIGKQTIQSVKVYSITGQLISQYNNINAIDRTLIKTYNLNAGNYILIVTTDLGQLSKKVSVR